MRCHTLFDGTSNTDGTGRIQVQFFLRPARLGTFLRCGNRFLQGSLHGAGLEDNGLSLLFLDGLMFDTIVAVVATPAAILPEQQDFCPRHSAVRFDFLRCSYADRMRCEARCWLRTRVDCALCLCLCCFRLSFLLVMLHCMLRASINKQAGKAKAARASASFFSARAMPSNATSAGSTSR